MFKWKSSTGLAVSLGEFSQCEDALREAIMGFLQRLDQQQAESMMSLLARFARDAHEARRGSLTCSELFPIIAPTCPGLEPAHAVAVLFSASFSLCIKEVVQFALDFQQERELEGQEKGQPGQEKGQE
jgi:hypothetical protein